MARPRKITDTDVRRIKAEWQDRPTYKSLARKYRVSVTTIGKVLCGERTAKGAKQTVTDDEFASLVSHETTLFIP